MMTRKTLIKQIAIFVTLVYFALSSMVLFQAGEHAAVHNHGTNHAKHHTSFICNWMCAASSAIHSADFNVNQDVHPSFEKLPIQTESFFSSLSVFHVYIRPPPVVLV
jgi:hypothetical protein